MTSRPDDIHALLSGQLDGVLSAEDQLRLEQLLQSDPGLQKELDALSAIRTSLLKGRRQGRLGTGFASKVTQAALTRAEFDSHADADWIPRTFVHSARPAKADLITPIRQRYWIPLAAVAASLFIALLAVQYHRLVSNDNQARLAANRRSEISDQERSSDETKSSPAVESSLAASTETAAPPNTDPAHQFTESDLPTIDQSLAEGGPIGQVAEESTSMIAAVDSPVQTELPAYPNTAVQSNDSFQKLDGPINSTASVSPKDAPAAIPAATPALPAYVLMAVHISQDSVAAKNQALSAILDKHEIVAIDDLAMDQQEIETLLATGAAGKLSQNGANVYFLKGHARNLSGAIEDLCAQYKDFPEFGINITIDDSAKVLVKQLQEIEIGESAAVATKVGLQTPNGFVSSFERGKAIPKSMPHASRKSSAPNSMLGSIDTNPISYLLLVVRNEGELANSSQLESTPPKAAAD